MTTDDRPMFLLGPIAACLRWTEELANIISGPMLVVGLGIALVDLLTAGDLIAAVPWLLYAWAISQAVGVDAQLIGAWDRAKRALLRRQWWTLLGLVVLGCALAYVGYVAALVFATQEANHVTEAAALASLGMNATTWLWQRVGVSVFLVALSGWTRYRAPRQQTTIEDEQAKLQRELTLEPLRQQVRGLRLLGVREAATTLLGRDSGTRSTLTTPEPLDTAGARQDEAEAALPVADDANGVPPSDTAPAPSQEGRQEHTQAVVPDEPPVPPDPSAPVPFTRRARRLPGTGRKPTELRTLATRTRQASLEAQAFALLDDHADLSVEELRRVLGCAKRRAGELKAAWRTAQGNTQRRTVSAAR